MPKGESTDKKSDPGIKVTDRRLFTRDGERREEVGGEAAEAVPEAPARPAPSPGDEGRKDPGFERRPLEEPEGVDFTMLINAMAQPALLFLGEIPDPRTNQPALDPDQAKIQIDMLDLLRVKCRGNLSPQEEQLLERVLYQLRMLYVARVR